MRPSASLGLVALCLTIASSCNGPVDDVAEPSEFHIQINSGAAGKKVIDFAVPIGSMPRFERIGIEQGLSQNTVFCILQDSRGFMWFGTEYGLNRFDGYQFSVYQSEANNSDCLSDSWITSLSEDHTGMIWIGTLTGGLCRYNWDTDEFAPFKHDPTDSGTLTGTLTGTLISNEVTSTFVDSSGSLWVGTKEGLDRYDSKGNVFVHYLMDSANSASISDNHVMSLYESPDGYLWVGTHDGIVNRLDRKTGIFTRFTAAGYTAAELNGIHAITGDPSGRIWIGTEAGLFFIAKGDGEYAVRHDAVGEVKVRSLIWNLDGTLWIGTRNSGLLILDPAEDFLQQHTHISGDPFSLSSDAIESIYRDREGTIWLGTLPGGVNKLSIDNTVFTHLQHIPGEPNSLSDNWVRSVYEDDEGMLWIGTGTKGLNRYNREDGSWKHFRHDPNAPGSLSSDYISMISSPESGQLYVATGQGLDVMDTNTEQFSHYFHDPLDPESLSENDFVWLGFKDANNQVWVATHGGGLNLLEAEHGTFARYLHDPMAPESIIHDNVWNIYEDSRSMLWVGTTGGLDKFSPETQIFYHYMPNPDDPMSLSHGFIGPIVEDKSGDLWIGTIGGGINRLDPATEKFSHITVGEGLPSNAVMGMLIDIKGNVWASTSRGLAVIDPRSDEVTAYDKSDGVPISEFNGGAAAMLASGELAFGGVGGLIIFDPQYLQANQYIPPIVLTSISRDGNPIKIDRESDGRTGITLRRPDNAFEFEFSALSYSDSSMNRYAYKLEGLDTDWTYSDSVRVGRYRRLPGGNYTLKVIGSNDDGLWNTSGASLNVSVIPPFWATWWFRGCVFLLVAGAITWLYRARARNVADKTQLLKAQVAERTYALEREVRQRLTAEEALHSAEMESVVSAERGRLARDLHDSVTQSLYSLTLFIGASRELNARRDHEQLEHGLERSADTALQALKELRLLVYELRPLALREMGLVGAIQDRLDAVEKRAQTETELVVDVDPQANIPDGVEEALFRIAQEALNNTLKHAHATSITVRFECTAGGRLELEISDNGSGFSPTEVEGRGGVGLRSIRERADRIGAECTLNTLVDVGTRILIVKEGSNGKL